MTTERYGKAMDGSTLVAAALETIGRRMARRPAGEVERDRLRTVAEQIAGMASEVRAAYEEQRRGQHDWGVIQLDVEELYAHAALAKYEADIADWMAVPANHRAYQDAERAGKDAELLAGYPKHPGVETPARAAPDVSGGWSVAAQDFLRRARAARVDRQRTIHQETR